METQKHILPYNFVAFPFVGKVAIHTQTTPSRVWTVTKAEAQRQLKREDLDVHRRMMYEKVLEVLEQ
jgi:hypothetical protein